MNHFNWSAIQLQTFKPLLKNNHWILHRSIKSWPHIISNLQLIDLVLQSLSWSNTNHLLEVLSFSWKLGMAHVFPITIFGREILLLRVIPTVESFEIEKVVNGLFFIGIFSIGIFFLRTIYTRIILVFLSLLLSRGAGITWRLKSRWILLRVYLH